MLMYVNDIEEPYLTLIRSLIELNGLSISKAAEVMNIQRSNLSSWLNGKPNVFSIKKIEVMLDALGMRVISDSSAGIRLCYLSTEVIHLWQVEKDGASLSHVLRHTEPETSLKWMEIIQVDALPNGKFNLIRRKSESGDLLILLANKDVASNSYPISPESLGFGKAAGNIKIPLEKWIGWWKTKILSVSQLRNELESLTSLEKIRAPFDDTLARHELESAINKLKESQCTTEGLKAIIREFLHEIKRISPGNRLLNHEERDKIFNDYYDKESKLLGVQSFIRPIKNKRNQ